MDDDTARHQTHRALCSSQISEVGGNAGQFREHRDGTPLKIIPVAPWTPSRVSLGERHLAHLLSQVLTVRVMSQVNVLSI